MLQQHIGSDLGLTEIKLSISVHEAQVDAAKCSKSACPACQAVAGFSRKDVRRRKLRYLDLHLSTAQQVVVKTSIRLVRWKCIACQFTFTDYPDFRTPL
jgi:transposase-like protein